MFTKFDISYEILYVKLYLLPTSFKDNSLKIIIILLQSYYLGLISKCKLDRDGLFSFDSIFTAKTIGWSMWNSTGYRRDFAMVTVWNEDGNITLTKWPEYSEGDLIK